MSTDEEIYAAFQRHRENHAMLLVLLRGTRTPLTEQTEARFQGEFAEIEEAIERHSRAVKQLVETAIQEGTLADQRSGRDRRLKPFDRRWPPG